MFDRRHLQLPKPAIRGAALAAMLAWTGAGLAGAAAAEPSAEEIWKRTVESYAAVQTYADTGSVEVQGAGIHDKHTFLTRYRGPRNFFMEFTKNEDSDRYVIWSDAEAFHTWWRTTGLVEDYPVGSGAGAFGQADFLTAGAVMKLAPLLFSQAGLQGPLVNFKDPELEGSETVASHDCYKLVGLTRDVYAATGREVNIRQLTVWIDKTTSAIIKTLEGVPKGTPPAQGMQTTTTFEPVTDPKLDDESFKFDAPAAN